ncbi:MAG: hypothetical protein H6732_05150 [Alphaproteobacteria bacterium]|nr:hypothetical protein [Alphaproteobacteria bacterium]
MIVVAHRRNGLEALRATPAHLGVEVDVRSEGGALVVAHDPGERGPRWEDWLAAYRHALLVVNLKEEGLIAPALAAAEAAGVADLFLLGPDPGEALPWWRGGEGRVAVRVSEVHHPGTALGLQGLARWVWLDGFDGFPVAPDVVQALRAAGYRICLVSPELYGRPEGEVEAYRAAADATGVAFDAVCTRCWDAWGG